MPFPKTEAKLHAIANPAIAPAYFSPGAISLITTLETVLIGVRSPYKVLIAKASHKLVDIPKKTGKTLPVTNPNTNKGFRPHRSQRTP